jgi:ABC-type glycerol-3-phosphate transport system permease component
VAGRVAKRLHAVRPGLVTVGLFAFLVSWNEFFAPCVLLFLFLQRSYVRGFMSGALKG